jgi:hypothetical protein
MQKYRATPSFTYAAAIICTGDVMSASQSLYPFTDLPGCTSPLAQRFENPLITESQQREKEWEFGKFAGLDL